jgi:hypothetical protein
MIPEESINRTKKTMLIDDFPFDNITDYLVFSIENYSEKVESEFKNDGKKQKLIDEILKKARQYAKEGKISSKFYGWKEQYKKDLQK